MGQDNVCTLHAGAEGGESWLGEELSDGTVDTGTICCDAHSICQRYMPARQHQKLYSMQCTWLKNRRSYVDTIEKESISLS